MEATARVFKDIDSKKAQSMQEIGIRLRQIVQSGTKISAIADDSGANRSYVSSLVNNGTAGIGNESLADLWAWVMAWEKSQGINEPCEFFPEEAVTEDAPDAQKASDASPQSTPSDGGLIRTEDFVGALGFCEFMVKHREIGVVSGMPGTGKTTVAETIEKKYPHVIRIDAWLSMRIATPVRQSEMDTVLAMDGGGDPREVLGDVTVNKRQRRGYGVLMLKGEQYKIPFNVYEGKATDKQAEALAGDASPQEVNADQTDE